MTRPSAEAAAPTRAILERAIASDREAVRALVDALSPIIQARCARMLIRRRGATGRDVRQEVVDLTQHVFMALFADGGRVLRSWDPGRGASLENFVGLVAEREVAAILRSRRRNPWTADPVQDDDLEQAADPVSGPESEALTRDRARRVIERASVRLSDRGVEMLHWLVLEGRSVEEVCALGDLTADAVYAWRSRIAKLLREVVAELESDPASSRSMPLGGHP